jgi:hypothetical protein
VARTDLSAGEVLGAYLARIAQRVGGEERDRLLEELRDHLEDAVAAHRARGVSPTAALELAVQGCGSPAEVAAAVHRNSERMERVMAATRWTAIAGILAVPAATVGVMFWHPLSFVVTFALAAAGVIGLLAAHWARSRALIATGVLLLIAGNAAALLNPVGSAPLALAVGIPSMLTLAAVTLGCAALLRERVVPASAVLLMLGGVVILLALNTVLYVAGNQPPYLAGVGGVLAIAGWLWVNGALAVSSTAGRPAAAG